jgi:hypothetical protein
MHRQTSGVLHGHCQTVEYLQRLGPQHIELILEFSKWVINEDADDGFLIFTSDDFPEIAQLPQDQVLAHLQASRRPGAAPCLLLLVCCLVLFVPQRVLHRRSIASVRCWHALSTGTVDLQQQPHGWCIQRYCQRG